IVNSRGERRRKITSSRHTAEVLCHFNRLLQVVFSNVKVASLHFQLAHGKESYRLIDAIVEPCECLESALIQWQGLVQFSLCLIPLADHGLDTSRLHRITQACIQRKR